MANSQFQENQRHLNDLFYESHKNLIQRVCIALNKVDKAEEMTALLLGDKLKMKFKKDPNKPKKPKSGFLFFCDKKRPELITIERNKGNKVVIGNIAKALGKIWASLSEEVKNNFNDMKEKDKVRYVQAMEQYNNKIYSLSE